MALRTILEYPDPRLRTKAQPVTQFDAELARLVEDMFETMYAAPGIGLAATQVDVHKQVIVIDVSQDRTGRMVFINPQILSKEGVGTMEEGCLSVPGIFDEVERAAKVRLDHLDGKLFVDYLSDLKRERIRKKLDKDRKERAQRAPQSAGSARAY
jgi:peptide deformylase